jgi:GDP-L-fucose synthase
VVWGTGTPKREFLYSDDMADACIYLMNLDEERFIPLLGQDRNDGMPPLINIGVGEDLTIRKLAETIGEVMGFTGDIVFDETKPDGTPRKLLDVSAMHGLGWRAKTSLREGVLLAYEDFRKNHGTSR